MHLKLKQSATNPAAPNLLQQQTRFDAFVEGYNQERLITRLSPRSRDVLHGLGAPRRGVPTLGSTQLAAGHCPVDRTGAAPNRSARLIDSRHQRGI